MPKAIGYRHMSIDVGAVAWAWALSWLGLGSWAWAMCLKAMSGVLFMTAMTV